MVKKLAKKKLAMKVGNKKKTPTQKAAPAKKPAAVAKKPAPVMRQQVIRKPVIKVKPVAVKTIPPVKPMAVKDAQVFEIMLHRLRDQLTGQVASLKGESLHREDAMDLAEDGTDAFDRQFALTLADSEQETVFEIDDALRRLKGGTYGRCEGCQCEVGLVRLKALPFAKMCIKCQSESEKIKSKRRSI